MILTGNSGIEFTDETGYNVKNGQRLISQEDSVMRIIDISNDILSAEVYEGDPVPELISLASLKNGDRYNLSAVNMGLHNGTHMTRRCILSTVPTESTR